MTVSSENRPEPSVPVKEAVRLARTGAIVQALHVAALALALSEIGRW